MSFLRNVKAARFIVQTLLSSVGLALFVTAGWIAPTNNFAVNVISGVVLYAGSNFIARFLVGGK